MLVAQRYVRCSGITLDLEHGSVQTEALARRGPLLLRGRGGSAGAPLHAPPSSAVRSGRRAPTPSRAPTARGHPQGLLTQGFPKPTLQRALENTFPLEIERGEPLTTRKLKNQALTP